VAVDDKHVLHPRSFVEEAFAVDQRPEQILRPGCAARISGAEIFDAVCRVLCAVGGRL